MGYGDYKGGGPPDLLAIALSQAGNVRFSPPTACYCAGPGPSVPPPPPRPRRGKGRGIEWTDEFRDEIEFYVGMKDAIPVSRAIKYMLDNGPSYKRGWNTDEIAYAMKKAYGPGWQEEYKRQDP